AGTRARPYWTSRLFDAIVTPIAAMIEGLPAVPASGQLGVAALIIAAIGVTMASNNLLVQYGLARGRQLVREHPRRQRGD
ncbi:hypothetical protein QM306_37535, partial [Burkholderia cenocepacia]|nr:hypothetical protein [Burkholderia cenocepacia]